MPGALPWAWSAVRPLYLGPAAEHADSIRRLLKLPDIPTGSTVLGFNYDTGERYLSVEGFLP